MRNKTNIHVPRDSVKNSRSHLVSMFSVLGTFNDIFHPVLPVVDSTYPRFTNGKIESG